MNKKAIVKSLSELAARVCANDPQYIRGYYYGLRHFLIGSEGSPAVIVSMIRSGGGDCGAGISDGLAGLPPYGKDQG